MDKIYEIMTLLIWEEQLPEICREHRLHGNLEGVWDCHIEGDWVLIYQLEGNQQPRPKGTGYVVLIRYLYSRFNTFFKRPKAPPRKRVLGY
jgi:addiction module RelE/StbE family toxin